MVRLVASVALSMLLAAPAFAAPFVQTFELTTEDPLVPTMNTSLAQDLRIAYVFTTEDLLNAQIVIDLPPNLLLSDTSATAPFDAYCTAQNTPDEDPRHDWRCTLSSPRVVVGTATSGTLELKVTPAYYAFTEGQPLTIRATLTASNLQAPVVSEFTTHIDPTHGNPVVYDYVSLIDIATVENPADGRIGIESTVSRSPTNTGSEFIGRGVEARTRFPVGQEAYFLWPYNVQSWMATDEMWDPVQVITMRLQRLFGVSYVYAQGNGAAGERAEISGGGGSHYPMFWTPCTDVVVPSDISPEVWAPTSPGSSTYSRIDSGNTVATTSTYWGSDFTCTTDAALDIYMDTPIVGSDLFIRATHGVPMGAVPLYDTFLAMEIDTRLSYSEIYVGANYLQNPIVLPFDLYACSYPTGEVDLARFLANHDEDCELIGQGEAVDPVTTNATHIIAYKDEFFIEEPYGRMVPRQISMSVRTFVACAAEGTLRYATRSQSRRVPGGAIIDSGWGETERPVEDQAYWSASGPHYNEATGYGYLISADRGEVIRVAAELYSNQLGKNPRARFTLPPGVRFIDFDYYDNGSSGSETSCESPAIDVDVVEDIEGTTVSLTFGAVGGGDWYYVQQCEDTDCFPASNGTPYLYVQIDPEYPWLDGEQASFVMEWETDNSYGNVNHQESLLTINVPAQQRLDIEPTCSGTAGSGDCSSTEPDGRTPGLLVTMSNRGGEPLSDLTATIDVPKLGDQAGSQVDTTIASISNPNGLDIDCWNGSAWTPTCNASSLQVRARTPSIGAGVERTFTVFLNVIGGTTGDKIYGRGSLESNELAPVPAASVSPIRVNLCPGRLVATVFFDTNGNGVQDPGEPVLNDWSIQLTDAQNTSELYPIDVNGELDVAVARGAYTWTALRTGVWVPGSFEVGEITGDDIEICPDTVVELHVPVTCSCDDGYACTIDSCNFLGQCSTVYSGENVPQGDYTCNGMDDDCDGEYDEDWVSTATTCTQGGCTAPGVTTCYNYYEGSTCVFDIRQEICDGLDNDCDGMVDIQDWDVQLSDEVCNGRDDDCDGMVDAQDWSMEVEPCYLQQGVCAGSMQSLDMCMTYSWAGTTWTGWAGCQTRDYLYNAYLRYTDSSGDRATYVESWFGEDDCDSLDNDCDGVADEDFEPEAITCTSGACVSSGTTACDDGVLVEQCGSAAGGTEEVCDGVDNDCDGLVDASDPDLVRPPCDDQDGVCLGSRKPLELCEGIDGWGDCVPPHYSAHAFPTYATSDVACDGLDNDCDGAVDEDFVGQLDLCAPGSCSPTARNRCVAGQPRTGCEPFREGCAEDPGDLCEEACAVATELVVYGVAEDAQGIARGSFRCVKSQAGVVCDTDQNGVLSISDILWCGQ